MDKRLDKKRVLGFLGDLLVDALADFALEGWFCQPFHAFAELHAVDHVHASIVAGRRGFGVLVVRLVLLVRHVALTLPPGAGHATHSRVTVGDHGAGCTGRP